jgi:hypothetical protein
MSIRRLLLAALALAAALALTSCASQASSRNAADGSASAAAPTATSATPASVKPSDTAGPGSFDLPTAGGTALAIAPIEVSIDHVGPYSYTSPDLPTTGLPNSMSFASKVVGTATLSSGPEVSIAEDPAAPGKLVIKANFTVSTFSGSPALVIQPPVFQGTAHPAS